MEQISISIILSFAKNALHFRCFRQNFMLICSINESHKLNSNQENNIPIATDRVLV